MALQGSFALAYTGVSATNPPQFVVYNRAPTTSDYQNFNIGTIWEYQIVVDGNPPTYNTSQLYILVATAQSIGTWKRIKGSSAPTDTTAINQIIFDTPGTFTYTPSVGMVQCVVECLGAGSGGQAAYANYGINTFPGSAGAYAKKLFTAVQIGASQSLTIGAGGAGGVGENVALGGGNFGADGGSSSFGDFLSCGGGSNTFTNPIGTSYAPPTQATATGGDINVKGATSNGFQYFNVASSNPTLIPFSGCDSIYGSGGQWVLVNAVNGDYIVGNNATGYGSGGGGASCYAYTDLLAVGGNGAGGLIIITEYLV